MLRLLTSLSLALWLTTAAHAEDKKATPSPTPSEKAGKSESKSSGESEIQIPVAEGQDVKGLKIPQYDEQGNLVMLFDAEIARKLDSTHVAFENLTIEATSEDGKKFYVETPKSIFNLENRILTGTERVLIRRDDFEITGTSGEFQTRTRFAKVFGNIKMIIFNTENFK